MVKVSLELSYGMEENSSLVAETEELSLQTPTPWNKRMLLILDGYQEQLIASTTKSSSLDWEMDLLLRPISVPVKWLLSCKVTTSRHCVSSTTALSMLLIRMLCTYCTSLSTSNQTKLKRGDAKVCGYGELWYYALSLIHIWRCRRRG